MPRTPMSEDEQDSVSFFVFFPENIVYKIIMRMRFKVAWKPRHYVIVFFTDRASLFLSLVILSNILFKYVGSVFVSFFLQTNRLYECVIAIRLSDGLEDIQNDMISSNELLNNLRLPHLCIFILSSYIVLMR
jgi:hypothetical protein